MGTLMTTLRNRIGFRPHQIIRALHIGWLCNYVSRIYYYILYSFQIYTSQATPIAVLQVGKVGSSTVTDCARHLFPGTFVAHIHFLSEVGELESRKWSVQKGRAYLGGEFWASKITAKYLASRKKRVCIITLTREPVARNISAFFQSIDYWVPQALDRYRAGDRESLFEEMRSTFLESYPHSKPLRWFDSELNDVIGFDVYPLEFLPHRGFGIYESKSRRLLIIRLEDLSQCYQDAFSSFFGVDTRGLSAIRKNSRSDTLDSALYSDFTRWLTLPDLYLREQYGSKYSMHFYTSDELAVFYEHWRTRTSRDL